MNLVGCYIFCCSESFWDSDENYKTFPKRKKNRIYECVRKIFQKYHRSGVFESPVSHSLLVNAQTREMPTSPSTANTPAHLVQGKISWQRPPYFPSHFSPTFVSWRLSRTCRNLKFCTFPLEFRVQKGHRWRKVQEKKQTWNDGFPS